MPSSVESVARVEGRTVIALPGDLLHCSDKIPAKVYDPCLKHLPRRGETMVYILRHMMILFINGHEQGSISPDYWS